jgi:type IV pilus assembly protein PilB
MSEGYFVTCWNCLGEFDAMAAVWCSDDPKNPSKVCPFCLRCFCEASGEYKQQFWRQAPQLLVDELQTLGRSLDRLGDILIRMKRITTSQLLEALVLQRETGQKLGSVLVERGLVSREDVDAALRHQGVAQLADSRTTNDWAGQYWQQSSPDNVLDYLLGLGARKRASDLTLEPQAEEVAVRYRIDGFSFRIDPVPKLLEPALERALFALFGLDPARRSRPLTARTSCRLGEDNYDLVMQTVPGPLGLSVTIRLINRSTFIKDFGTLGLDLEDRVRLVEEIRSGRGLILVSSPAYNGAMTTVYSIMSFLAQSRLDVLSIEAPIQWHMDGVRQVEADVGPNGPEIEPALRAMVAVRPDALILTAVPDHATAMLISQLASSLLVVAHVPATTAARAVVALRELGVPLQVIGSSLGLVTAQRLVRVVCTACRVPADPPSAQTLLAHGIDSDEARTLSYFKGTGCPSCNTVGYRGRRAVFEALPASESVRATIEQGGGFREIEQASLASGMIGMRERCLSLVRTGVTTFDEFARLRF